MGFFNTIHPQQSFTRSAKAFASRSGIGRRMDRLVTKADQFLRAPPACSPANPLDKPAFAVSNPLGGAGRRATRGRG